MPWSLGPRVLDWLLRKVEGMILWNKDLKRLRNGGSEAVNILTDNLSSDYIARRTLSYVGSLVFIGTGSSTVLRMKQIVALTILLACWAC
jgi:hypothetical protein